MEQKEFDVIMQIAEAVAELKLKPDAPANIQLKFEFLRMDLKTRKILDIIENADEKSCKGLLFFVKRLNNEMDSFLKLNEKK